MTISMHAASVPIFIRALRNLRGVLEKGAAHAQERKIEPAVLLQARLFPDMLPLVRQVQFASDNAKGCSARLAGVEVPRYEDNESSFDELYARIDKTIAFIKALRPEQFEGSAERRVTLPLRTGALEFEGLEYLRYFALPNFFFHCTTAYNLLRHSGVPLGKSDFLGRG